MKKKLITIVAILCVCVLVAATLTTLGLQLAAGGEHVQKVASATTLADEIAKTAVAPSNATPLPKDYVKWDGTYATGFSEGTGKRGDPFIIRTPQEFAFFIRACKQYAAAADGTVYYTAHYKLEADLVFNDDFALNGYTIDDDVKAGLTPFSAASGTTDFGGTFNGNGHIIYNMYIPYEGGSGSDCSGCGVFGQVAGTIIDLHFVRGYIQGYGDTNIPGCGTFARELTGTIEGCSSGMTLYFRGGMVGGIVGTMKNKSATKTASLKNCTFTGEIYAYGDNGARAGYGVGGILGIFNGTDDKGYTKNPTLTDCINRGVVTSSGKFIGGIIGQISGSTSVKPEGFAVARCVNFGTVQSSHDITATGTVETAFVGGIIGGAGYMKESNPGTYHMEHCANFGLVRSMENSVGGLIGTVWIQNGSITSPMRFYSCYSLGEVRAENSKGVTFRRSGEGIGAFMGRSNCPVEVYDAIVGGTVRGNNAVGGLVGILSTDTANSGGGHSKLTVSGSYIAVDVSGKVGVGAVVGNYVCGSTEDNTVFKLVGSYVTGTVTGEHITGSVIGNLSAGKKNEKKIILDFQYSVTDVVVKYSMLAGQAGILIGGSSTGVFPTLRQTEFYAASKVYDLSSGVETQVANARPMFNVTTMKLDKIFAEDNLTNGSYLSRLEFGAAKENSSGKWVASTLNKKPIQENTDRILSSALGREYDGLETKLEHRDWLGVSPICGWEVWDGTAWVAIDEAPRSVGKYRVKAALLSSRASGAAVLEFEITKKLVDFEKLKWGGDLMPSFTGHEYVVELAGVPAGITVTYTDSRKTNAGVYTAHLVSAVDGSGNYDIINVDKVKDQIWQIQSAVLDMRNVEWYRPDPNSDEPRFVYNDKEQSVYLIDKTDPDRDLSLLLNIEYKGNTAIDAGENYYAEAKISYDRNNVSMSYFRSTDSTNWSIARREIRPIASAQFAGGTALTGDALGITTVYDAREHALLYRVDSLPSCVKFQIEHLDPDRDGEDDGKYIQSGTYSYRVTFSLEEADLKNNYFALARDGEPEVFDPTADSSVTEIYLLLIEKATPKIYGAINQATSYVTWDPEKVNFDDKGNMVFEEPQRYAIGIQYNQDTTICYDEETGKEISTLFVDMDGIQDLRNEIARISKQEYFTVRYYEVLQERDENGKLVDTGEETPVLNRYGSEIEADGSWARPYNVGKYRAVVTYQAPANSNFTDATTTAILQINAIDYDLPLNIVLCDEQIEEDGDEHILRLQYEDTLPSFITPVYTCNNTEDFYPSKPGKYLFTVQFVFSPEMERNYQPLKNMNAYLTIITKSLYDYDTDISLSFKEGTHWRLLIRQEDHTEYVTDWSVGFNTAMQSIYKIELKDELSPIIRLKEPATLRIPLTPEMAGAKKIIPVLVTRENAENGNSAKYKITKLTDFTLVGDVGKLPTHIDIKVDRIGTIGIVTSTESSDNTMGRYIWLAVAGCMIVPATVLVTVTVIGKKRKKKNKAD